MGAHILGNAPGKPSNRDEVTCLASADKNLTIDQLITSILCSNNSNTKGEMAELVMASG